MSAVIQQSVGAVYLRRIDGGEVKLTVTNFRDSAGLELNQSELFTLYAELGILLVERHASG